MRMNILFLFLFFLNKNEFDNSNSCVYTQIGM